MPILHKGRLGAVLRLLLFLVALAFAIMPLLFVRDSMLQFLLGSMLLIGLLSAWSRHVDRRPFSDYGLVPLGTLFFGALAGLIIGIASVAVIFTASVGMGAVTISEFSTTAGMAAILPFFLKMLLVGIWEEVFFRGFLFTSLRDVFSSRPHSRLAIIGAMLASSLLFGLAHSATDHASIASLAILTVNGVMLCIAFLLTGNLGLSIGFHAAWNFAQSKIFGFAMSGNAAEQSLVVVEGMGPVIWTGGAYGPEGGLAGLFGLVVGLCLLLATIAWFPRLSGRDRIICAASGVR